MENNIDSIFNNVASKKINYYRLKKGYSLEKVVNKMKNPVSRQMLPSQNRLLPEREHLRKSSWTRSSLQAGSTLILIFGRNVKLGMRC